MRCSRRMTSFAIGSLVVFSACVAILLTTVAGLSQQQPPVERAYRIAGVYEVGRVVSLEVTPLEVRLPLSITERRISEEVPAEGYYLEILDRDAKTLLRMGIDDPSLVLMEYEDPNVPGRIVSKEIHPEKVEFSMLVPAPTGSRTFRFMKVAPDQRAIPAAKRLRYNLGTFILPATDSGRAVPTTDEEGAR